MTIHEDGIDLGRLLDASQQSPTEFAQELANEVRDLVSPSQVLVAVSDQAGKVFRIKACAGLARVVAEVARDDDDIEWSAAETFYRYEMPASIAGLLDPTLGRHVAVYVNAESPEIDPERGGHKIVLCVYVACDEPDDQNHVARVLGDAMAVFGRLYNAAIDQSKLSVRRKLVQDANNSRDLGSLMHRSARLARTELDVERVVALLPDDAGLTLNVRAVYPRPGGLELPHYSVPFDRNNPQTPGPVGRAVLDGLIAVHPPGDLEAPLRPLIPDGCLEAMVVPLVPLDPSEDSVALGVLVCLGKYWEPDQLRGTFLWEDVLLLEFFSDMLTTLTQMLRSRDEADIRVERVLHGAKTTFGKIRDNLSLLEENGASDKVPREMQYLLGDAIALLDDLSGQLERKRLSSLHKIERNDAVRLYADVLTSTSSFAVSLARAMGRNDLKVSSLAAANFRHAPVISSNTNAVVTVFRNLMHNAVKYSIRDETFAAWIDIAYEDDSDWLHVFVSDNGIGIDVGERAKVFIEGYRSIRAMQMDPTGLGVGLSDCKEIMARLDGGIEVVNPRKSAEGLQATTTFRVSFPLGHVPRSTTADS